MSTTQVVTDGDMTMSGRWSSAGQELVLIDDESSVVALDGRVIVDSATVWIESISPNLLVFANTGHGNTGYYNLEGERVIPTGDNEFGGVFSEDGIAIVTLHRDNKVNYVYYIDQNGNNIFGIGFDEAYAFASNDLALVKDDGKYGYINKDGEFAIPAEYDFAYDFEPDGYARVGIDNKMAIINSQGELLTDFIFEWISRVTPYDLSSSLYIARQDGLTGIIDMKGNWILPPQYNEIYSCDPLAHEGPNLINCSRQIYAMSYNEGKFGIVSGKGEILLPAISEDSCYISTNGYMSVQVDGKYGYVDLNG